MFYNFITKYTDIFYRKNERSFCNCKTFSYFFSTKYIGLFEILNFNKMLTSDVISFEQTGLDPSLQCLLRSVGPSTLNIYNKFIFFCLNFSTIGEDKTSYISA